MASLDIKKILISAVIPLAIALCRPFALSTAQACLLACIALVIIWWSFGAVKKNIASLFLLAAFILFGIPLKTVFTFPLSDSFIMIAVCYLFSKGIDNAAILPKVFAPLLRKWADTPIKTVIAAIAVLFIGIWCIPQSLARLLMTVTLFNSFLALTDAPEGTKEVIRFGIFVFYAAVNMTLLRADIILNTAAVGFAGLAVDEALWAKAMGVPGILSLICILMLYAWVFHRQVAGIHFSIHSENTQKTAFDAKEIRTLCILIAVVALWAAEPMHGIKASWIAIAGTALMFVNGNLHKEDFRAIDYSTLLFLTAAFSIGGTMVVSGIAEHVFGAVSGLFPKQYSILYVLALTAAAMGMHMVLGSNTTTLSIVLPGFMTICAGTAPLTQVFFIAYFVIAAQYILPFHSVAMMIGSSDQQFPASYVSRFGIRLTLLSIVLLLCIYLPWWQLIHLI